MLRGDFSHCVWYISHYGKRARRISRISNVGPEELAYPVLGSCKRLEMQDIKDLFNGQKFQEMYDMYQAQHDNAWFQLDYGGNPEGIFTAACPPEALHALENGIIAHLLSKLI